MKRKVLFSVAMASTLTCSYGAFATSQPTDLTTRNYVDEGLSFVYQKAKAVEDKVGTKGDTNTEASGLAGDVAALESAVGDVAKGNNPATGLRGDVATLQTNVSTLQSTVSGLQAASKTYANGAGIAITEGQTEGDPYSVGLNLPENVVDGASYVFQPDGSGGGSWVQLSVTDTWDASAEARIINGSSPN